MAHSTAPRRLYWRLAAGLLVAAGLYGWFVTAKYGRLNGLNQRQLAKAAAELKSSIQNAVGTVTRRKTSTWNDLTQDSTGTSPICLCR